jgi:hypothetical protein
MPAASRRYTPSTTVGAFGIALLLLSGITIATPGLVAAQNAPLSKQGDLTITPTEQDLTINSGLIEGQTKVTITNNADHDLSAVIKVVDFEAAGESGAIAWNQPGSTGNKYGLVKWLVLPGGNTVQLPKGKTVDIPIHIENRSDLAPGGHYAGIIAQPGTATNADGNRVGFKQELISLLFVKKVGGAQFGLQLQSLSTGSKRTVPTEVPLRFRSTGNVYVVPRGYVTVTDPKGKMVAKGTINPDSTMILPETSRKLITLMQPVENSDLPGKYTVTAYYRYDGQSEYSRQSVTFTRFIWPQQLTILLVISGVILLFVSGWIIRRKKMYSFGRRGHRAFVRNRF